VHQTPRHHDERRRPILAADRFRSPTGPVAFCRLRGYLFTLKKQSQAILPALKNVFAGHPLFPDLAAG